MIDRGTGGVCDLPVRWVAQDPTVGEDYEWEACPNPHLGKYAPPLPRVAQMEGVRDRAAVQSVSQLVRSACPGLAYDADGLRGDAPSLCPLEQKARDGTVKQ